MRLRRLFFILSVLLWLVVSAITANSLSSAWSQFNQSKHGMQAIEQLQAMLTTNEMASRERGPANGVLGDDYPPDPTKVELLEQARQNTDQAFEHLLHTLQESNPPIYSATLLAQEHLEKARIVVDTEANKARDQRDASQLRGAVKQMVGVIDDLSPALISLTNEASASFPSITDTLMAAIQAASLREYAGQLGSQLTAALTTKEKLKLDELEAINQLRGRIEQLNEQLITRSAALKQHQAIQTAIDIMHDRYFDSALPFVEEQVRIGLDTGNYEVDTAQFAARYVPDMDSIVMLRNILMNDAINSADKALAAIHVAVIKTTAGAVLLFLLLAFNLWLLHRRVIVPLAKTTDLIVTLANGNLNVSIPTSKHKDEFNDMLGAISVLKNNSIARQEAEETIRQMAFYDPLTELPNRRLLEDRLHQSLSRSQRLNSQGAVLFIDLDNFKPVNDLHGHEAGDWLLTKVASRLLLRLRAEDTAARLGGDEFVVLINDLENKERALVVAEKIRLLLEQPFIRENGVELTISASIGIVIFPKHTNDPQALLRFGDEAMYLAKRKGRNSVEIFEPEG